MVGKELVYWANVSRCGEVLEVGYSKSDRLLGNRYHNNTTKDMKKRIGVPPQSEPNDSVTHATPRRPRKKRGGLQKLSGFMKSQSTRLSTEGAIKNKRRQLLFSVSRCRTAVFASEGSIPETVVEDGGEVIKNPKFGKKTGASDVGGDRDE